MSIVEVKNSILRGTVQIPPSKSVSHRALICSYLAGGGGVGPIIDSNDMRATRQVLQAFANGSSSANCIESGSTMRFMIPVAAALGLDITFVGEGSLLTRTVGEYLDLLPQHGVSVESDGCLPMRISGRLQPGDYSIAGDVSSQYLTGLLLALPLLDGDSRIELTTQLQSKPYVDMTVKVMSEYGVVVEEGDKGYFVPGNQKYKICDYNVESDWSQAAFFLAAGVIGGDITLTGLDMDSTQGDKAIVDILRRFGGDITVDGTGIRAVASQLTGTVIDATDTPDLVPILAVVAAHAQGETVITGAERLRYKESDRLLSVCDNLERMGAQVTPHNDGMTIVGGRLKGARLDGYNDHRIVMSFCVAALDAEGDTAITHPMSINKSYPTFFDDYNNLGGRANVLNDR